jgi:predicted transcriptional regulator with HTH domain
MKKLTAVRVLGSSWHLFLPLLERLYRLEEVEKRGIVQVGKQIVGCPVEQFGNYYESFNMLGGKPSEPHLHLVEKVKVEGRMKYFKLTDSGRCIGKAYFDGETNEAKRLFLQRCVEKIPQFEFFLREVIRRRFILKEGKFTYFLDDDQTITLDKLIKKVLTGLGYDATCNPWTIHQFIQFCARFKLFEIEKVERGMTRYTLKTRSLAADFPEIYRKIKPPVLDLDFFVKVLVEKYMELSGNQRIFIPVSKLREKICEYLEIKKEIFDRVVVELEKFNPDKIKTQAGPAVLLGEPLLKDSSKTLIKIEVGNLFIPKNRLVKTLEEIED